jgi:hypothetical protein
MRAVDKVFQCSDMRRCILNFIITKFVPCHRAETLKCSKVMKYYKKQLEDFSLIHPKLQYDSISDSNVFDSNIDNYILEFIKFSNEFKKIEANIKKRYHKVGILVNEMMCTKYNYSENLNMIGYNIQVFLCICCPSNLPMTDISKLLMSEICKLNVPWVSLICSDFNYRLYE